jgi:sortase A
MGGRPSASARLLRLAAIAMIVAGALALVDAGVTLLWQEPFSALYALFQQDQLKGELAHLEKAPATPVERRTLASIPDEAHRISYLARQLQDRVAKGSPIGRIVIPRIHAKYVVVYGTGTEELESGPGVYPETHFPGIPGTTAIAGHRTTYLAPFRHIDELAPGDVIQMQMPYADLTYTVVGHSVVSPEDVQAAIARVHYSRLVLSACTPLFSAAKRLLVFARLTRLVPEGAAKRLGAGRVARGFDVIRHRHSRVRSPVHRLSVGGPR